MKKIIFLAGMLVLLGAAELAAQTPIVLSGKELFGDLTARQIGPALMSGRVSDLEGHPTNDRIIYAGTAGGGVWRSANGGATFTSIFDEYVQSIGTIALDPQNPDRVIWVGTGETWTRNSTSVGDGLFKSIDGGVNWTKAGFEGSERISSIEIHPENSQVMYVGVLGPLYADYDERGVFKSEDGGATWSKVLSVDATTGCSDVVMDPNDPNTLYASMWEFRRTAWSFNSGGTQSALYKSTDAGATWNKIHNGFPSGKLGRIAVAVAPSNSNILYSVIESEKDENKGLYRSDDGGASWEHLNKDFGLVVRPFYFSRIVVDPRNPDVVVKAGLTGSISRDGGKTFKNLGNMHSDIHDILFDIDDSDRMYVATDGGVYRTWDGGTTMEIVENLPISQFYQISVDNEEPYNIYGGLQDNGSWWGPSSSPGGIEGRDWNRVGQGDGFRVLRHATKPIVYSEMQGAENVWRYDIERNRTKTIQPLAVEGDPKLRFNWNAPISLSPHKPDRIYIGSQFVHMSDDMGDTWRKISGDLTTNDPAKQDQANSGGLSVDNSGAENHCTIFTIAESPVNEQVIWAGTDDGNVQVTTDGGSTWNNVAANITGLPANTWCYHIEASVHGAGIAYAVFDGHTTGDWTPYAYKTTDYGKTWTSVVSDGIYGFVRNIQEDYENENLLFLGTEFGLYITVDGGANWSQFTNNMPAVAVHYIDLQAQTNDLVMGTHGRGIIILDDISPLREINQDVLQKNVHFFATEPAIMEESSGFGGASGETQFVGPNSTSQAKIIYYLKRRHTFGKMTMEIQDAEGNVVSELPPGKSKGINVVTWAFRTTQPKVAKAKTFTFGAFTAPRVQAGTYTVVLKKGREEFRHELVVENDPNSLLTEADREKQRAVTMELYDMTESLAYLVYQVDGWIAEAEAQLGNPKAKKTAQQALNELTAFKKTLVITTGDNYVGAAEPELRERIAELYGKVAGSFDPPTAAEMANLALMRKQFAEANAKWESQQKWVGKLKKYRAKAGNEPLPLQSKEEFLAD